MAFSPTPRLYFAYGASLSTSEMKSRCPTSTFYGIAVLRNHRWFINERGYANIAPSLPGPNVIEDVVWGILYTLRPFDEELLDKHEGIPWAYSKADMDVEAVSITEDGRGTRREVVRALVYIDRERVQESYAWPEFAVKMNKGAREAAERGLPSVWISKVVRSCIVDPSNLSAVEGQAEADVASAVHNGARPTSATRPDSDRASHTQEIVVGAPVVNGGLQKERSSHISQSYGLEKSKYAQESFSIYAHEGSGTNSGASRRRAIEAPASQKQGVPSGPPDHDNKQLECWWWKVKSCCRFSDEQCAYAHYDTGVTAQAPGTKKRGLPLDKKNAPLHPRNLSRWERSPTVQLNTAGENNEKPSGYQQDWSAQQGKSDAHPSWSEQVENLMDSEPEWLAANDREDVKW